MHKFKTTNIKGKDYVEVNQRLLYFRNEPTFAGWSIESDLVDLQPDRCCIKAIIRDADGRIWILDVVRGQYDTDQRDKVIKQTAALDGRGIRIRLPQDPGQAGKSQAMHMLRLLHGSAVTVLPVTGSKDVRAEPFASQVAGGNVYMVAADWNRPALR